MIFLDWILKQTISTILHVGKTYGTYIPWIISKTRYQGSSLNVSVKNNDRKWQPANPIDVRGCPQVERNIDHNYDFACASTELDRREEILTLITEAFKDGTWIPAQLYQDKCDHCFKFTPKIYKHKYSFEYSFKQKNIIDWHLCIEL